MRARLTLAAVCALAIALATAAPALASGAGEGLAGETNDKVVTFFSLGVVLFFVAVVTIGTVILHLLDRRKDARKAARGRQRVGW